MDTPTQDARFDHPPVRSVYLAVYFDSIDGLQVSHLSALREEWRSDYPVAAELPPLRPRNRDGDEMSVVPVTRSWPFPYLMWAAEDDGQALHIQDDRFVLSWTFSDDAKYPGFDVLSKQLEQRLAEFAATVLDETGENLVSTGAECKYSNRIDGYTPEQMMVGIATRWSSGATDVVAEPLNATYAGVRLHTCTDHEMRGCSVNLSLDADEDGTFLLIESERDLGENEQDFRLAGLDIAHEQLIRKFLEFTSPDMHRNWGRIS